MPPVRTVHRAPPRPQDDDPDAETVDPDAPTAVDDMEHDEHEGLDEASLKEHEEVTKVKNVSWVELGKHRMETWYYSPFPKEYCPGGHLECLYVCEFTMRFFRSKSELQRYQRRCKVRSHPPGNEIYRNGSVSFFEVDGSEEKEFCQNLCYFAKLFLDHKVGALGGAIERRSEWRSGVATERCGGGAAEQWAL